MWLPGAGVGGEDLAAKNAKGAKKYGFVGAGLKPALPSVQKKIACPLFSILFPIGREIFPA